MWGFKRPRLPEPAATPPTMGGWLGEIAPIGAVDVTPLLGVTPSPSPPKRPSPFQQHPDPSSFPTP
jgi:hypothetical protein